jgi:hypothetical protein
MNKKLFSWKALAGLALLVAMGLTSCKQGTEVDPTDPYSTKKPTTPSASTKGTADVTITIVAGTDLADQYTKWESTLTKDQTDAIAKASEFTIGLNVSAYKLDGKTLTIPKVWADPTGKTLNLVFNNGFAETKNALIIDADAFAANANVNITLPGQEFAMALTAAKVRSSIASEGEATISQLTGTTSDNSKNALKVSNGVTVKALNLTSGLVAKNGGDVIALVLAGAPSYDGNSKLITSNGLTFENLIIDGVVNINGDKDKTKINNIAITKNGNLTLTTVNSVANIEGLADFSKKETSQLTLNDQAGKVSAIKNVEVLDAAFEVKSDIFSGVIFDNNITLSTASLSKVTAKGDVAVKITENNKTISFAGVDAKTITVDGSVSTQTDVIKTSYKWDNTKWVAQSAVIEGATEYTYKAGKFYIDDTTKQLVDNDDAQAVPADKYEITIVEYKTADLKPKNAVIALDGNCKVAGAKIAGSNITSLFGGAQASKPFYTVTVAGVTYAWEQRSDSKYVLIAQ